MNLLRAVRTSAATLAALALCSCAQPGIVPSVSEPSSAASRIRVVNDSANELRDLHLLFPQEEVAIGDVAPGSASGYVEVPQGVYNYSAFRFLRGGESVVQPVIDFVGETPLPVDDYTYLLGVDEDRGDQLELLTVFRSRPSAAGAPEGYTADGKSVSEGEPPGEVMQPTGNTEAAGTYTYPVGYDHSAPLGEQVEQLDARQEARRGSPRRPGWRSATPRVARRTPVRYSRHPSCLSDAGGAPHAGGRDRALQVSWCWPAWASTAHHRCPTC